MKTVAATTAFIATASIETTITRAHQQSTATTKTPRRLVHSLLHLLLQRLRSPCKKSAVNPLVIILLMLPLSANAALTTSTSLGGDNGNVNIYNNTGSTLDDFEFDLSSLLPNTYTLTLDGGLWNETGDLSDQIHTFAPIFSSLNLQDGDNTALNIAYNLPKLLADYGISDLSTLGVITYTDAVIGESASGDLFYADITLRDFASAVVPVPAAMGLFASGLLGLGIVRKKFKFVTAMGEIILSR